MPYSNSLVEELKIKSIYNILEYMRDNGLGLQHQIDKF